MNCHTAEGMVSRYINHTLSVEELEEFLKHIQACSSCYEELETYFIVHEAVQQLDEKEEESMLDFQHLLEQDIKKSRHYIRKRRATRALAVFLICLLLVILTVFLVFIFFELREFL